MIRVSLQELPDEVRKRLQGTVREIAGPALRAGALRCQAALAKKTPVYTGMAKAGWTVRRLPGPEPGWATENGVPYLGVVEGGARPHAVSREGIEALTRWFQLKGVKRGKKGLAPPKGGRRPSKRGLKKWLKRFFGAPGGTAGANARRPRRAPQRLSAEEARDAAFAFAAKLKKEGWKGTFFVKRALPELERHARAEVQRHLEKYARGPS